jgi:hypothetical protein
MAILCLQGGVYYAFLQEDERPNFEQSARKINEIRVMIDAHIY